MRFADPKRWLPMVIALLAGGVALASFVQPNPISDGLLQIAALVTTAGVLIGILNILSVHLRRIAARTKDWGYSLVLIVALLGTFTIGVLPGMLGNDPLMTTIAADLFRYVYQPLTGAILALLTFFALRAAWRALQVRPGEASIILGVAVLFLLASGPWTVLIPGLDATVAWIRAYPVLGVARGLLLGVGIGALVASARLLLGLDQPYLDR